MVAVARQPTERDLSEAKKVGCSAYLSRSSSKEGMINAVTDALTCRFTSFSAFDTK